MPSTYQEEREGAVAQEVSGDEDLKDKKLLRELLERIMLLADLPTDDEFHIMAANILERLDGDWDEPCMAAYMRACTFDLERAVNRQPGYRAGGM